MHLKHTCISFLFLLVQLQIAFLAKTPVAVIEKCIHIKFIFITHLLHSASIVQ